MKKTLPFALVCAAVGMAVAAPAAAETAQEHAERRMKSMDKDTDGTVSLEEYTEFRRGWTSKRDDAERLMQPALVKRAFDRVDTDGDGTINFAEVLAETAAMPQHSGG